MMWQTHYSGHALSPPPTGRDGSEDTQVELILTEHSYEQLELKAILFLLFLLFFNILASMKIKEQHQSVSSYLLLF